MANDTAKDRVPTPEAARERKVGEAPAQPQVPAAGRPAFRDLRRELKEEDLAHPGVHKLILDDLERADAECVELKTYVGRYHDADKRSAVLEEKLRTDRALEVFFGTGTTLGGAIVGLSPYFSELFKPALAPGLIVLAVGGLLMAGAITARLIKR